MFFLYSERCVVVPCDLQHIRVSAAVFLLGSAPQQIHQGCPVPRLDPSYRRHGHPSVSFDPKFGFPRVIDTNNAYDDLQLVLRK
jgi:hypothetical protein